MTCREVRDSCRGPIRRAWSFALCLGLSISGGGLTAQDGGDAQDWRAAARERLEQFRKQNEIPGMSAAIGVGEAIPFADGFGTADVENDVPATAATVYRLASISKPITAVCALRLVEQGRLDLDAPVSQLVEAWPAKRWPVTTRQLLGHLGGVRHYKPLEGESTRHYATQTLALERFRDDPLLHEPGSKYRYTTFGYNLAAAVVEARAGAAFPRVVQELVSEPSGALTLQDDDVRRIIKHRAQGYRRVAGRLQNSVLMDGSYKLGGGGLCSNAPDLVRFGQALLHGKLVQPETLAKMWTEQRTTGGAGTGYGLGFGIAERSGHREISHTGAQSRVSTVLYMRPDSAVVVVILCNLQGQRLRGLARELAQLAE